MREFLFVIQSVDSKKYLVPVRATCIDAALKLSFEVMFKTEGCSGPYRVLLVLDITEMEKFGYPFPKKPSMAAQSILKRDSM